MLGRMLHDPDRLESELGSMTGLGLLDFEVTFQLHKTLAQRTYTPTRASPFAAAGPIAGYEIHCGDVRYGACAPCFVHADGVDGAADPDRLLFGTFIHHIFRNPAFTRVFVDIVRRGKGLAPLTGPLPRARERMDESYERLAAALEQLAIFSEQAVGGQRVAVRRDETRGCAKIVTSARFRAAASVPPAAARRTRHMITTAIDTG
jgi:adenosylcobyric acid synthase